MSQTVHPLDDELIDFAIVRQRATKIFLRNREIDPEERAVIQMLDRIHGGVGEYRQREVAADAYKRNGNTRHVQARFREAGDRIISIEAEREARKIVPFPSQDEYA